MREEFDRSFEVGETGGHMTAKTTLSCLRYGCVCMAFGLLSQAQANELPSWLQGDWDLNLRYRFEHVDDNLNRNAKASTVRAAGSYRSAEVSGFGIGVEVEHVSVLGNDTYNNGGANGKTQYAVVADPKGTEFNQAYIQFSGLPNTTMRYGRQEITHRPTPFHRYVGSVLWRQNYQSFDGFHLVSNPRPDLTVNAGYIHNVNRIFGEGNDLPNRSDFDLDGILFRTVYSGFDGANVEGYVYNLDFTKATDLSTRTLGLRISGERTLNEATNLLYAVEGARQTDVAANPRDDLSLTYWMLDIGIKAPNMRNLTLKLTHERMEGDGLNGFRTPIATLHAYQGWTDKFLATPATGLKDTYLTLSANLGPVALLITHHDFRAEQGSFNYGREWGLMATTKPMKKLTLGFKFAHYDSNRNSSNIGPTARDATKFWAWAQLAL